MKQIILLLPEFWASYLINEDHSSLSVEEKNEIDNFLAKEEMKGFYCVSCSDDFGSYYYSNDANNIAGNCLEFTFLQNSLAAK